MCLPSDLCYPRPTVVVPLIVVLTNPMFYRLPGVPPTNKPLSVPMTSIVNIRGDRLYHEHIAWDQGTVLRQLGLLPEYLPFPYPVPGVDQSDKGKYEYRVPVGGIETSRKLADETSEPSNAMLNYKLREASNN